MFHGSSPTWACSEYSNGYFGNSNTNHFPYQVIPSCRRVNLSMMQNMLKRNNKVLMMNSPLSLLQRTCDVFQQDAELIEHCKDRQRQWELERRLLKRKKKQGSAYQELQFESLRKDVDDLNDLSKTICFAILDLQNHSTKLYCNSNQENGDNSKLPSDENPNSNIYFNDVNHFKKENMLTDNDLVKEIRGTISLGDRLALLGHLKTDELLAALREEIEKEEQDRRSLEEKYQQILNENNNLKKHLLEREVLSKKQEEIFKENIENQKEREENKTELKKLQTTVSDLESINKSLNADIEVTKESLKLNVQERARAFVLLRDAKRENRELQERLQAHERQSNINFSNSTKSDDFEIRLLQSELEYYKEMLENKNDFIQELQQQIDTFKVERLEIQEEMFTKEKNIESLQSFKNLQAPSEKSELFSLTRQDSKNKSKLKKQELYIVSLQKEIDNLKEELLRYEKEKNNADKETFLEIKALKETYENQIKEHVIAEQECRVHLLEQKEQATCLRNELQVLIRERSLSQSETHSKNPQDEIKTSYENIIEKTQSELEQSVDLIKHLQEERRNIKLQYNEEMTTMRKQIDQEYQTVITEIKKEKVHIELEIETLRKELHLVQSELENSRSELNSSKQLLKLKEKDLESSKEELVVAKQKLGQVSSSSTSDDIEYSKSDIKEITAMLQQELQIYKQKEIDAKIVEENLRSEVGRLRRELNITFAQSNKHDFVEGHGILNEMKEPVVFQRRVSTENL